MYLYVTVVLLDRKGLLYTGGGIHVRSPGTKSGQKSKTLKFDIGNHFRPSTAFYFYSFLAEKLVL